MQQSNCPGKEAFLTGARDLSPATYRELVATRARVILNEDTGRVKDERKRRDLERQISDHYEKINLGADFLPVSYLYDGAKRARSVCRLRTPTGFATGFLIAPGVLMTNNHVLGDASVADGTVAEFGLEGDAEPIVVQLRPGSLFITNKELDFSIVRCDRTGIKSVPIVRLTLSPSAAVRGERLNIVQHPSARPKEIAIHENRVTRILDRVVRYRTDTQPGSSGSPVFNDDWELVALHHAGWAEEGGKATNEGILAGAIVRYLIGLQNGESTRDSGLGEVLAEVNGTSPLLGFFDMSGLSARDPREIEVPSFTGDEQFADVGFWNIEHFNRSVSDARVAAVAEVFRNLSMDAMGLTEVSTDALDRLALAMTAQGKSVDYELLDVRGAQEIAILYDKSTTEVKQAKAIARRNAARFEALTPGGKTAFPRKPLIAKVLIDPEAAEPIEFVMIVVHLKAYGDAQSRARRRLAAQMLREVILDIRETEGLPVVLGGDFNEVLGNDVLAPIQETPDMLALTADDAVSGGISYVGKRYRSLIDHVVVSSDVSLGDIQGDDAAIVRLDKSTADFADTVSDHVPVVFRMVMREAPVDVAEPAEEPGVSVVVPPGADRLKLAFLDLDDGNGQGEARRERLGKVIAKH